MRTVSKLAPLAVLVLLALGCGGDSQTGDEGDSRDAGAAADAVVAADAAVTADAAVIAGCGDGVISDGEYCDGTNVGGLTCQSFGLPLGALACDAQCSYVFDGCGAPPCGATTCDCPTPSGCPAGMACVVSPDLNLSCH